LYLAIILAVVFGAANRSGAQEVTVSVAISMKDAVEELGRQFQKARPTVVLRFNLGASGELQKQIEAGAPVDLFISAAQRQMDELEKRGLILSATRRTVARNVLTVIVPADSRLGLRQAEDLLKPQVQRIVIGNPKTVPAGQYAEACRRTLNLWEPLKPKLVFSENVRQALEYVSRGEVEAGFVYATDAAMRVGQAQEAFRPPIESYPPVTYPAATVAGSRQQAIAQAFVDLLLSTDGQRVLSRFGFLPPSPGPSR
jgi:molybdate transport system substrate-binding protein